jgi:hypothetical protein
VDASVAWPVAVSIATLLLGGLVAYVTVRRTASGRVGTSEAATLWAASEKMRGDLIARLDKVTEQRDRLMESHAATVIPALSAVNESLQRITESLAHLAAPPPPTGTASRRRYSGGG